MGIVHVQVNQNSRRSPSRISRLEVYMSLGLIRDKLLYSCDTITAFVYAYVLIYTYILRPPYFYSSVPKQWQLYYKNSLRPSHFSLLTTALLVCSYPLSCFPSKHIPLWSSISIYRIDKRRKQLGFMPPVYTPSPSSTSDLS